MSRIEQRLAQRRLQVAYRLEKWIPIRSGVFVMYGGTYKYRWAANIAWWFATMCPDLRDYKTVNVVHIED